MTSEDTTSTPVELYARCNDCGLEFVTEELANAHMDETLNFGSDRGSHSITRLRPLTDEELVERRIQADVDNAMDDLFNKLELRDRFSEAQIRDALKPYMDWSDAYEAFCDGEGQ